MVDGKTTRPASFGADLPEAVGFDVFVGSVVVATVVVPETGGVLLPIVEDEAGFFNVTVNVWPAVV